MSRGIAGGVLLTTLIVAGLFLVRDHQMNPYAYEEMTLYLGTDRRLPPSMWGVFPPSPGVASKDWSRLGIRIPKFVPPPIPKDDIEVRAGPRGAYLTIIGGEFFLTQRPVDDRSPWTLYVPKNTHGPIHITSRLMDSSVALGIERPGEFSRLAWSDGRWHYVLFSPFGHSLDTLYAIGNSLR